MNIDEMPAGRDMDKLIAQKIFSWLSARLKQGLWNPKKHDPLYYSCDEPDEVPHYSTDIVAAWKLIQRFTTWISPPRLASYHVLVLAWVGGGDNNEWACAIGNESSRTLASTAALAICRAALKAASQSDSRPTLSTSHRLSRNQS